MRTYQTKKGYYQIVAEDNCEYDEETREWKAVDTDKFATVLLKHIGAPQVQFAKVKDPLKGFWEHHPASERGIDYGCSIEL